MWQAPIATSYQQIAQRIAELATSKHISALAVNAGGAGYTDGDLLTITHAGATLPCTFVVTVAAGVVTGITRIVQGGAFSNRVATVTKNAGGSGYAVNDVVRLTTGTYRQWAKAKVLTLSGSAVATCALFESGGSYSVAPSASAGATDSTIGTGVGTGLTVDTTMTGLVGTSGIAATGGTGAGATFNLTLTDTGWVALDDRNDFSFNSVTTEKEIILEGTPGASEETPLVGIRTATNGSGGTLRHFLAFTGFTSYNPSLAYDLQPNAITPTPTTTSGNLIGNVPADVTIQCWFSISERKLAGVVRADGSTVTAYHSFYCGLLDPFGTATENPYPMVIVAAMNGIAVAADSSNAVDVSGLTEFFSNSNRVGPAWAWEQATVSWNEIQNGTSTTGSTPFTAKTSGYTCFPVSSMTSDAGSDPANAIVADGPIPFDSTICRNTGVGSSMQIQPTPNTPSDIQPIFPVTITFSSGVFSTAFVFGDLANVYWVSGTKAGGTIIAPEDTFTVGTDVYRVFPNGSRIESYSFFCMKEGA